MVISTITHPFFVSPEHPTKWSYEVLTRSCQYSFTQVFHILRISNLNASIRIFYIKILPHDVFFLKKTTKNCHGHIYIYIRWLIALGTR